MFHFPCCHVFAMILIFPTRQSKNCKKLKCKELKYKKQQLLIDLKQNIIACDVANG